MVPANVVSVFCIHMDIEPISMASETYTGYDNRYSYLHMPVSVIAAAFEFHLQILSLFLYRIRNTAGCV